MKRNKFTLYWNKAKKSWVLSFGKKTLQSMDIKRNAIKDSVTIASDSRNHPSQLIIKKKNGQIQEERTYPKSSDPKRSKG